MVMTGKIHRVVIDGVDITPSVGDYSQQQIDDALATRRLHCPVMDEVELAPWPTPGTARRLCVMSGTNMGKTYGPSPIHEALQALFNPRTGIEVCDVCGCAHRSHLGHLCNSCFEGIRGVEHAQMMERFKTACEKLSNAAVQCGVSFGRATEAMAFFVDSEPMARAFNTMNLDACLAVGPKWEDSVADPIEDILRARDKIMQFTRHPIALTIEDEISKLKLSSIFGRLGDRWQDEKRPANAKEFIEQRNTQRQKNRGPTKHSEWWNKGKRWQCGYSSWCRISW